MIKMISVGDICTGDHYFNVGNGVRSTSAKYGPDHLFANVSKEFRDADIVTGNLECVISDAGRDGNSIESVCFRGEPGVARALKSCGFNLINIANNHIMQHGIEAFQDTVSLLTEQGINVIGLKGTGSYSSSPVTYSFEGSRIAFLGYSLVKENYYKGIIPYANSSVEEILWDIERIKSEVTHVCLSLHYGYEGLTEPSWREKVMLAQFADAGADIILGHHSHVFQPVIRHHKSVICYSLGNFIFDLFWLRSMCQGNIVKLDLDAEGIHYSLVPYYINKKMQPTPRIPRNNPALTPDLTGDDQINYQQKVKTFNKKLFLSKVLYFFANLHRGDTRMKCRFIIDKLLSKWKACHAE